MHPPQDGKSDWNIINPLGTEDFLQIIWLIVDGIIPQRKAFMSMKNHAFIFSAFFILSAFLPLPEFVNHPGRQSAAPAPRHLEEIAYDNRRNVLYLFGGAELRDKSWKEPDDFFEFAGAWKNRTENGPCGRRGHAMVYDLASDELVVIGGVTTTASGSDSLLFDTWIWSEKRWMLVDTKCPVKEGRAVYNTETKSILLYGDSHDLSKPWNGGDVRTFELWEFRNRRWTKLSDKGPSDGPFPLAYNQAVKSLALLEWRNDGLILWEWKSKEWIKKEFKSNFPHARAKYAFAYSSFSKALFVFAGIDSNKNLLGDFWM
ncbi:MAG TPA: hypothetical protein VGD31_03790, partial [Sphingobacteriaceae bacterium]